MRDTTIDKLDNNNDKGWMYAQRWYKAGRKAYDENDKDSFIIFLRMRNRELFYLSEKELERVILLFQVGIVKFNLGVQGDNKKE